MKREITLCYRKIINSSSNGAWEKLVFEDSFNEFKMQAQYYNQEKKHHTFAQLLHDVPQAEKLHFLVSAAVVNYIKQLNGTIPDITNNLGLLFLKFNNFRFEIINSDIRDINKHAVAINFYSEELAYIDQIGNYLLTAKANQANENGTHVLTDMFTLSPFLTIYSIKQ